MAEQMSMILEPERSLWLLKKIHYIDDGPRGILFNSSPEANNLPHNGPT